MLTCAARPVCRIDSLRLSSAEKSACEMDGWSPERLSTLYLAILLRMDASDLDIFLAPCIRFGLTSGLSQVRVATVFKEASSSSATTCASEGEPTGWSCITSIGLDTKTELPVESRLEDDMRETHSPCLAELSPAFACGSMTGSGGTGQAGGRLVGAPRLTDLRCIDGRTGRIVVAVFDGMGIPRAPTDLDLDALTLSW